MAQSNQQQKIVKEIHAIGSETIDATANGRQKTFDFMSPADTDL